MKAINMKSLMAALVMLLAPSTMFAQDGSAQEQGQAQAQGQGAGRAQAQTPEARIDAAMNAAAEAKIPLSLVKSKVAEGEAKRVPQERIATAVEARVKSLVRASETLQRADIEARNEGELLVSADALDAGVSESALVRISQDAPPERRTVAVAVLADLVRLGAASDNALARVSGAVSSNSALANLHAEVAAQLQRGGLKSTLDATGIIRVP
ncbi:MAG TPA: hypothetical protein VFD64_17590 [Gemmatimonadaceae bacterium]|nr:hypothetical protein [Gemmatimonadaceae bacterium]